MEKADLPSIITIIRKSQTRWEGHVICMSDSRTPKQLLYGEFSHGSRKVGGQRKHYCNKDSLKANLKDFNIDIAMWETTASDRPPWEILIHKGANHSENKRSNAFKDNAEHARLELIDQPICPPLTNVQPVGGVSMPVLASQATYRFIAPSLKHFMSLRSYSIMSR